MFKPKAFLPVLAFIPFVACTNDYAFLKNSASLLGAQDEQEAVEVQWFKAGYYVGVKAGKSEVDSDSKDLDRDLSARGYTTSTDLENDDSTFSLYGGYRFREPFSVELAWVNLGQVESEIAASPPSLSAFLNDVADVHPYLGKGVNLKGIYHVVDEERFQLGLSLGLWYWNADVQAEAASGSAVDIDESGLDLNYGLQGLIPLGNAFSVLLAWEQYMLDDNDASTFWLGVQGSI